MLRPVSTPLGNTQLVGVKGVLTFMPGSNIGNDVMSDPNYVFATVLC